jgi:GR25 family glycosyltransferase involved in LPS biosynthesis
MKYSIMYVNDRAVNNISSIKATLSSFEYVDNVKYVDASAVSPWVVLDKYGVNLDNWKPYDGRTSPALPGELGHLASTLNVFQYIIDTGIDKILIIEDDAVLNEFFVDNLNKCMNDLPKNFDFLSLYYNEGHNQKDERTEIGSKYIQKSLNQYSGTPAIVYTLGCAKKFIKILKRKNIEYTTDCMLYKYAADASIEGYSIIPNNLTFISHDQTLYNSIIDPENHRNN